jgi:hypothetical protein
MDDKEIDRLYEDLSTMIDQLKMGWVRTQVNEQIRLGKIEDEEIKVLRHKRAPKKVAHSAIFTGEFQPGPKESFLRTVEYDSRERLLLLIDAVEQAIANTAEMEQELSVFFQKEGFNGFLFQPDEESGQTFRIIPDGVAFRQGHVTELKRLLNELREGVR